MGNAAVEQQQNIRDAFRALSHHIKIHTQTYNKMWPFVTMLGFESYGSDTLLQAGTELLNIFVQVENEDCKAYINFTTANHKAWVKESHMLQSRILDCLKEVASVTHNLQELTTRPQKCDAEVLPLPGSDSTVQTSQRLEQK